MATKGNPYQGTSVTVEASKEAIRKLLIKVGARGVDWGEDFEQHRVRVRFALLVDGNLHTVNVQLHIPEAKRTSTKRWRNQWGSGTGGGTTKQQEQAERATYRALYFWLKSQFEAVEFGLLKLEDVFLSHFEWMVNGQRTTVGQVVMPALTDPGRLLAGPGGGEVVEGEFA